MSTSLAAIDSGKGADQRREIRTILQDIPILATGLNVINNLPRRFELDADGKKVNRLNLSGNATFTNITVETRPDEAQQLIYILSTSPGSLFVSLRNPNDKLTQPQKVTTVEDVRTFSCAGVCNASAARPGPSSAENKAAPAKTDPKRL